ncbi:hypothetical protein [Kitasatospora sp. MAP5-34]|nr:hypothetical protein [Kitasatospora sp. MAP5-34]MDH6580767.1 hypothetical protein [Kitasatospora sp. MAP5-34]
MDSTLPRLSAVAEDTAVALELTQDAVRAGDALTLPDALCAPIWASSGK